MLSWNESSGSGLILGNRLKMPTAKNMYRNLRDKPESRQTHKKVNIFFKFF